MYKLVSSLTSKIWNSTSNSNAETETETETGSGSESSRTFVSSKREEGGWAGAGAHVDVNMDVNMDTGMGIHERRNRNRNLNVDVNVKTNENVNESSSSSSSSLSMAAAAAVAVSSFFSPDMGRRKKRQRDGERLNGNGNENENENENGNRNGSGPARTPTLTPGSAHGRGRSLGNGIFRYDADGDGNGDGIVRKRIKTSIGYRSVNGSGDESDDIDDDGDDDVGVDNNNNNENQNQNENLIRKPKSRRTHFRLKDDKEQAKDDAGSDSDGDGDRVPAALDIDAGFGSCEDGDAEESPSANNSTTGTSSSSSSGHGHGHGHGHGYSHSLLLELIPQDVLQTHIASYLTDACDFYALQLTCRKFHEVCNTTQSLRNVSLWDDASLSSTSSALLLSSSSSSSSRRSSSSSSSRSSMMVRSRTGARLSDAETTMATTEDGTNNEELQQQLQQQQQLQLKQPRTKRTAGCILNHIDVPELAIEKLYKYAVAGNQQALYMIGMIAAYCYGDKVGVTILRQNAKSGCLRSSYTLSLILRDCNKHEADSYLREAVEVDYLPACQELLTSQEVKDRFGDLDYKSLQHYFDPIALNRILGRTYLQSSGVRGVSTSHCWNPNCGRWALKATTAANGNRGGPQLQFSSKYLPPLPPHLEACLLKLVEDHHTQRQGYNGLNSLKGTFSGQGENRRSIDVLGEGICMEVNTSTNGEASTFDADFSPTNRVPRSPSERSFRVSRMKMCSSCRRAKYCSKLCQVYDWRSGQHKMECQYLFTG